MQLRNTTSKPIIFLIIVAFATHYPASSMAASLTANDATAQNRVVEAELADLQSPELEMRSRALDRITQAIRAASGDENRIDPAYATESAKRAVTKLLRIEVRGPKESVRDLSHLTETEIRGQGEDYAAYDGALLEAVHALHDPGSIEYLYDPHILERGGLATGALAYFGHTEAGRILQLYCDNRDENYHAALDSVILSMLSQRTVDDRAILHKIEEIFLAKAVSPRPIDRSLATPVLSFFFDPTARTVLKTMAERDPYLAPPDRQGQRHYTIREYASAALRRPYDDGERD